MSLENDVKNMHLGFPRNYIALSRGFSSSHKGIDMCWNSQYGGQNAPVYAPGDGEVVAIVDGYGNTWKTGVANWGNYIKIKHATNVYTLSAHLLKGSFKVKIGDKVKRGQMVAQMNNSGYSNGSHVHFEVYIGGAGTGYRVDPLKYCYAYPEDIVHKSETNVMRYSPITYYGTPVARNVNANQIEVVTETLRARATPSTSGTILGFVNKGVYTVSDLTPVEANGYKWYKIENFWCANNSSGDYLKIYPAKVIQFNVSLQKLSQAQKDELVKWCAEKGIKPDVKEI